MSQDSSDEMHLFGSEHSIVEEEQEVESKALVIYEGTEEPVEIKPKVCLFTPGCFN